MRLRGFRLVIQRPTAKFAKKIVTSAEKTLEIENVGILEDYWPSPLSTLAATFTPLRPLTYFDMPLYSDSAMRWR